MQKVDAGSHRRSPPNQPSHRRRLHVQARHRRRPLEQGLTDDAALPPIIDVDTCSDLGWREA
jgi:hypothetical protein